MHTVMSMVTVMLMVTVMSMVPVMSMVTVMSMHTVLPMVTHIAAYPVFGKGPNQRSLACAVDDRLPSQFVACLIIELTHV